MLLTESHVHLLLLPGMDGTSRLLEPLLAALPATLHPQGQSHRQAADHGEQLERAERVRGHCSAAAGGLEW